MSLENSSRPSPLPSLSSPSLEYSKQKKEKTSSITRALIITAIKPALRDPHRINVFINEKYSFSLSLSELVDLKLKKDQQITNDQLQEYFSISKIGKLYQQTLEYCLAGPHSEKEVENYLIRKKYRRDLAWQKYDEALAKLKDPEYRQEVSHLRKDTKIKNRKIKNPDFIENNTYEYFGHKNTEPPSKPFDRINTFMIQQVILRLKQNRVINDVEFARFYVTNRHQYKGISRKRLILELKQKGISDEIIESSLSADQYGDIPRDETTEIRKMINKKAKKNTDRTKIFTYLVRQGFPYDLVKSELDSFFSNPNP